MNMIRNPKKSAREKLKEVEEFIEEFVVPLEARGFPAAGYYRQIAADLRADIAMQEW